MSSFEELYQSHGGSSQAPLRLNLREKWGGLEDETLSAYSATSQKQTNEFLNPFTSEASESGSNTPEDENGQYGIFILAFSASLKITYRLCSGRGSPIPHLKEVEKILPRPYLTQAK